MLPLRLLASASALLASLPMFAAQVAFNAPQNIATGLQQLSGYAVGDFNGDGKPDLAFTDNFDKRVFVYLNDGNGAFGSAITTSLDVQRTIAGIAAGDVNEDGKQDLIVSAVAASQTNVVLLGNGDGTFTAGGAMPNSYGFLQGVCADLNGDKHLDFIGILSNGIHVWLGDGRGNFTYKAVDSQSTNPFFDGLAVADFNQDGKPDLVIANSGISFSGIPGDIRIFAGVGDGTFRRPNIVRPFSPNTYSYGYLGSADVNGDGKLDLAFSVPVIGAIAFGNGDGSFQTDATQIVFPPQSTSGPQPTSTAPPFALADFDGDGTPDFAIVSNDEKHIYLTLNDGTGMFRKQNADFQTDVQQTVAFLLTADLNGDGLPDLIAGSRTGNAVQIHLSKIVKTTPTVALTSSASQVVPGSPITLTAKVTGNGRTPTGTVTFAEGTTSLGQGALDANGQATFTISSLGAGTHAVTANYGGDTRFTAANSPAFSLGVVDFALSLPTATQTISSGSSATYNLTVTGAAGLSGTVTLSCSGLPASYTCANTTTSLGAQPATATLTVSPAARAQVERPVAPFQSASGFVLAALPAALWLACGRRRSLRNTGLLCAGMVAVSMLWLSGCSSSSAPATTTPPTYRGTSTFTINASVVVGTQTLSHQTTATLTVQ